MGLAPESGKEMPKRAKQQNNESPLHLLRFTNKIIVWKFGMKYLVRDAVYVDNRIFVDFKEVLKAIFGGNICMLCNKYITASICPNDCIAELGTYYESECFCKRVDGGGGSFL